MSKLKKIIDKEIDTFTENLSGKELLSILTEGNKILDSLEQSYEQDYNLDNAITPENWKYFVDALGALINNEEFQKKCKEVNCKLYCVKYYTKLKFAIAENAEVTLKFELKKYFSQLVTGDGKEFMDQFFSLPFEFVSLVVRYLANVLFKDKKNNLTPQLEEAQTYYNDMQKKKNNFITEVNKISQGKSNVFSLADAQTLLDIKAFYEYNSTNIGVLEFIVRMLADTNTKAKLEDTFGKFKIQLMKEQALEHPSYIQFLREIKEEKEEPFFNKDGTQNKYRETTYNEYVMQYFFPDQYISEVPEEKSEEKPEVEAPLSKPEEPLTIEQPSAEELK